MLQTRKPTQPRQVENNTSTRPQIYLPPNVSDPDLWPSDCQGWSFRALVSITLKTGSFVFKIYPVMLTIVYRY